MAFPSHPHRPALYPASSTRSSSSASSMDGASPSASSSSAVDLDRDRAGRRALLRSATSGSIDIGAPTVSAPMFFASAPVSRSASAEAEGSAGASEDGAQKGKEPASRYPPRADATTQAAAPAPALPIRTPLKRAYPASSDPPLEEAEYLLPRAVEPSPSVRVREYATDSDDGSMFAGEMDGLDDEACFLDWDAGCVDFLAELPTELALLVMAHMYSHKEVLTASRVSRTWYAVSMDNGVWRKLFHRDPTWALRPDAEEVLQRQAARRERKLAREVARRRSDEEQMTLRDAQPETPVKGTRSLSSSPLAPLATLAGMGLRMGLEAASYAGSTLALSLSPRSRARHLEEGSVGNIFASPRATARRAKAIASSPAATSDSRTEFTFGPPAGHVQVPAGLEAGAAGDEQPDRYTIAGLRWYQLYKTRWYLEQRWRGIATHPRPARPASSDHAMVSPYEIHGQSYPGDPYRHAGPPQPPAPPVKSFAPTKRHLHGHLDSVYCVRYDADRRGAPGGLGRLVSGSRDHTIKVWDVEHGACIYTLRGHRASVLCLEFDDEILISGSSDSSLVLWDFRDARAGPDTDLEALGALASRPVAEGTEHREQPTVLDDEAADGSVVRRAGPRVIRRLQGHREPVLDIAFDARWIISCSKDTTVRVWQRSSTSSSDGSGASHDARLFRVYRNHVGPVNAGSLCGDVVVSASGDNAMLLWDVRSGDTLRSFEGHERGLACVVLRADLVVSGSNDHTVRVWDARDGTSLARLEGHEQLVRAVDFDPRKRIVVSGGYDKKVLLWWLGGAGAAGTDGGVHSIAQPGAQPVAALRMGGHSARVFDVRLMPTAVVSAGEDKRICIRDFTKGLGEECELFE